MIALRTVSRQTSRTPLFRYGAVALFHVCMAIAAFGALLLGASRLGAFCGGVTTPRGQTIVQLDSLEAAAAGPLSDEPVESDGIELIQGHSEYK